MGDEVDILPADKHKVFLQFESITLVVSSRKYQVCNMLVKSQGKREGQCCFFWPQMNIKAFFNSYYYFRRVSPGMPKLPKITRFLFLRKIFRKKCAMKLIFCIQIRMKICYTLIPWFLMGTVKHSQSSKISKFRT